MGHVSSYLSVRFLSLFLDLVTMFIGPTKSRKDVQPMILEHYKKALMRFISEDFGVDTIKAFPESSQLMLMNGLGRLHMTDKRTKTRIADLFSNLDRCVINYYI